jgi:hypothetical protein
VLDTKLVWVGRGADAYRADDRALTVRDAMAWLERQTGQQSTLTVLPGGEMLGYLARRDNPSRFGNFLPPSLLLFGEADMTADLRAHPPDWIALMQRDTSVYGPRFFGVDYAVDLRRWIDDHYVIAKRFGAPVFNARGLMGVEILARRSRSGE